VDGRSSLADVHDQIVDLYGLDDSDHFYAFFTSGRYWDKQSAYFDPRVEGARADRALLFRLKLAPGRTCAYLLDFGTEQRFTVTVDAVSDAEQPLSAPRLVESVGDVATPPEPPAADADTDPPELAELVVLAEAFLDTMDELDELASEPADALDRSAPVLRAGAAAALKLLSAVGGDSKLFYRLDDWLLERSLAAQLFDLPLELSHVAEYESALSLARALVFADREMMQGDLATILAKAGRREEALSQLEQNLASAEDAALVESKAGQTHRALGDLPAAEAYFRRALIEAKTATDRVQAHIRLASCLFDQGREAEANEVLKAARALEQKGAPPADLPAVGRNEPCPCGSGKKYKKCHGMSG
jgi:tetratricopeptide (TPR) repeat protein